MVSNLRVRYLLFFIIWFCSSVHAETKLQATVDRSKIYEMDTLNLTIQGEVDVDFSFGGLMNFGLGQTDSPDIKGLARDFNIVDTQQSYNMQSINGQSKANVLWRYTLEPKNVGVLEIPAIEYKGSQTKPIQITVVQGKAPKDASEPPAIFFEVETDKQSAYVQEQIIYTLRLYTQGLVNGNVSEPTSTDAIIESFGQQKKYYRMAFNQRYEVIERQYLVYPQKSGQLVIPAQSFEGISLKRGQRTRLRDKSDPIELTIKPPAPGFSGKNWLPAMSLLINDQWQGDENTLEVGDSITRKIEISALGLLASALPPISMPESPYYKLYTDKPLKESSQHESGALAKRIDSFAVVAINDGEIELDEVRIPWWDVVNDVERVAIIPAKKLQITPNPNLSASAPPQNTAPVITSQESISNEPAVERISSLADAQDLASQPNQNHIWQSISALLLLLWISSCVYFYHQRKMLIAKLDAVPLPKQSEDQSEKYCYNQAVKAVKENQSDMPTLTLLWVETLHKIEGKSIQLRSLHDLKLLDERLFNQLNQFEMQKYGKEVSSAFNANELLQAMKTYREAFYVRQKRQATPSKSKLLPKEKALEPFYQ